MQKRDPCGSLFCGATENRKLRDKHIARNNRQSVAAENSSEILATWHKKEAVKPLFVVPPRIELGTQGFSVLCSTN